MKNPFVATAEIAAFVEDMIAIPKALAFPDKPALYVLSDLILKGRNQRYLSHADFAMGFEVGFECGLDDLGDFGLSHFTFGMIVEEIEGMLSHARHNQENELARRFGWSPIHHSYNVGCAFGWLSALMDNGFLFRLPRTSVELQRRPVRSLLSSSYANVVALSHK